MTHEHVVETLALPDATPAGFDALCGTAIGVVAADLFLLLGDTASHAWPLATLMAAILWGVKKLNDFLTYGPLLGESMPSCLLRAVIAPVGTGLLGMLLSGTSQ